MISKILVMGFGAASMGFYLNCVWSIAGQNEYQKATAFGVASIASYLFMKLSNE